MSISSSKVNQKRYSLMLLKLDPKVHQTYKRLSQQSTKKKNESGNSKCSRNNKHFIRTAYDNFLLLLNQSSYPFGLTEQRFKWQNLEDKSNPINPTDVKLFKKHIPIKNSFDGGFDSFFNHTPNTKLKRNNSVDTLYNKINKNSQRVLYPEKDTTNSKQKGKKCIFIDVYNEDKEKKLRHSTGGSMKSLLDETPISFPVRGKKRVRTVSFDNKGTLNLFSEDYGKVQKVHMLKQRMHFNDVIYRPALIN